MRNLIAACGLPDTDGTLVQNLCYVAQQLGYPMPAYNFVWGNDPQWPRSRLLASDMLGRKPWDDAKLTDDQVRVVKSKLLPLIAKGRDIPTARWLELLAQSHYLLAHEGWYYADAVEFLGGDEAAKEAASQILAFRTVHKTSDEAMGEIEKTKKSGTRWDLKS